MRRALFRSALTLGLLGLALPGPSSAQQRPAAADATLFLLLPVGARAAGVGSATASTAGTAEAVWWNPAGLATLRRVEASLNHSQSIIGTSDALVFTVASPLGVTGISASVLDYGGGEATGPDSVPSGSLYPRNVSLGASHAVRIGRDMRIGATWKLAQFRFDCSGECPSLPTVLSSTTAFDFGMQYDLPGLRFPVHLGAAVRNLGVKLREEDLPPDQLPSRLQVGASVLYTLPRTIAENAKAMLAVDLIDELRVSNPLPRIGAEFAWEDAVYLRGGYVVERQGTESGGASLGIGFALRRLTIDFARNFSGLSADAGQPPAFLSLRIRF